MLDSTFRLTLGFITKVAHHNLTLMVLYLHYVCLVKLFIVNFF